MFGACQEEKTGIGDCMSSDGSLLASSVLGLARNLFVDTFMYPFEVVKIHQQKPGNQEKSHHIAWRLFNQSGCGVFYHGFRQEVYKTCLKAFSWPIIMELPRILELWNLGPLTQQAVTGITIGTASAAVSTPLEQRRIVSIAKENKSYSIYQGFGFHWAKLTVAWTVFLVAQKDLRSRYLAHTRQEKLTVLQLSTVGAVVALLVSIASAPFDVASTRKMGHNVTLVFFREVPRTWLRGLPLSAFIRVVNSVASVILIDRLNRQRL